MAEAVKPADGDVHGWWGRYGSPQTGIIYGDSGIGKDTDLMYAFPDAVFLGKMGSLDSWYDTLGMPGRPRQLSCNTVGEAIQWVEQIRQYPPERRPIALIISDLSLLATTTIRQLEKHYGSTGSAVFDMWRHIRREIELLADLAIVAGCHLWMNAHIFAPRSDKDGFWKGGPNLPSKKIVRAIPHAVRNVFKAESEASLEHFWQGVYRIEPLDPSWHMKSRMSYTGVVPMNTAELLRHRGYVVPRYNRNGLDLTWQDQVADHVVGMLDSETPLQEVVNTLRGKLSQFHPLHLQWAIRDGIDRRAIRDLAGPLTLMSASAGTL